ncbi:hypothetical protein [Streptomyces sp. NBC_00096]|uniref:hypothetical protein n=1 Tax=Streptomyces sp. NBC_00096 TaxID=2975650 RepID=UPI00324B2933
MSIDRIRHLVRAFTTAPAAVDVFASSPPSAMDVPQDSDGRDVVIATGSTPWTGEMAAPSFMILLAQSRR